MRIGSERHEDVTLLRTSDFVLFWSLKALLQLAEQDKPEQDEEGFASISAGLLQQQCLVQVQVRLDMKIIKRSPFQVSPFPRDCFNLTYRLGVEQFNLLTVQFVSRF